MPSSAHRCVYLRCQNKSNQKSMFRFPWNDKRRLKAWLDNCGNATIDHLPPEKLRNQYICIDHFHPKYIRNETGHRKRISKNAIPEPFNFQPTEIDHDSLAHSPASPELLRVYINKKQIDRNEDVQVIKMENVNEIDEHNKTSRHQNKTMPSSAHSCAYFMCQNKSNQKSMFRFPWNDTHRLKVWLDNCGSATIDHLPPEKLRNQYICIDHFDPKYVRNETGHRKRISKNAIPEPFNFQPPEIKHESHAHSPASPDLKTVYINKKLTDCDEDIQVKMEDINVEARSTPEEDVNEEAWSMPEKDEDAGAWKMPEEDVIKMEDVNEEAWSMSEENVIKMEDVNEGAWIMPEENVIKMEFVEEDVDAGAWKMPEEDVDAGARKTPEEDVRNETGHRKRIFKNAVPEPFDFPPEIKHESHAHSPASSKPWRVYVNKKLIDRDKVSNEKVQVAEMEFVNIAARSTPEKDVNAGAWNTPERKKISEKEENEDTPEVKKIKTLLVTERRRLKREKHKNKLLKNKIANKNVVNLETHKFKSDLSKLITKMQLRKCKSKKHWSEEEKQFCMSLYSKSPTAYKFMTDSGIVLANRSTVQRWRQEANSQPGLNSNSDTEITPVLAQVVPESSTTNENGCTFKD